MQSAEAKAADGTGSATGTTIKIAVYRSSYPLIWDLNDEGSSDVTRAQWAGSDGHSAPASWPMEGSPGSAVGAYADYTEADEPTRTGFAFLGWSAVADDPTVAGKLDTLEIPKGTEPVEGSDGVKSITLHALWAPIEYSVVFDLTKNPEDASAVPSFNWTTGKGTFTDLGAGRYRLSGVTLEDYDPEKGLIEIATPSRGTGGYRFLSWAEPESQQSPTVAMKPSGTAKWYVNPVALTHYDYEPVLTARWSLSFDVDVPSQITFDQYDSLEIEGNLTDTTDEDVVDEESPDVHDAGKMAHFCSQSTAVDYKIVALKSEMQATASDILTTSDSSKATQQQVLSDEKLLSLFSANDASESAGVHFKLTDAIDMDDSSRYGAFVIPKQTKAYSDADYSRDDEERLYVSYRLNLSNKVDGASEPNHGLVTPGNVQEGDRTPIAKVSYEFAVADAVAEEPVTTDFYVIDGDRTYGLSYIKRAANDLAANGTASPYYSQFKGYLDNRVPFKADIGGVITDVNLIGICQDYIADDSIAEGTATSTRSPKKAGLTFMLADIYALNGLTNDAAGATAFDNSMNPTGSFSGGWGAASLRARLNQEFLSELPPTLQAALATVAKCQQGGQSDTSIHWTKDKLFLASAFEVHGRAIAGYNDSENSSNSFQYQYFAANSYSTVHTYNGTASYWWTRSARTKYDTFDRLCRISPLAGQYDHDDYPNMMRNGVIPAFCL